ncbi:hypothetical protein [uncultured Stenotrophomonas sp.]|uniref:hypothetical protein n=1 Tax=uncultured Stenotrophomonas sp. TaxID=165438 RepID=UPI0028D87BF5|nr:hypothetical protein [uncultured Stenotrophomonas sp.]
MRQSLSVFRVLSFAIVATATLIGTTGCFKRGARGDYAMAPEVRPLEVPPDLNAPGNNPGAQVPVLASQAAKPAPAQAQAQAPAAAANNAGFTIPGSKEEVFGKVGTALESVDGVKIASKAQLLGSFDVNYESSDFLVRVVAVEAGAYISTVDPRGLPATGAAPTKLLGELKAKLAQ